MRAAAGVRRLIRRVSRDAPRTVSRVPPPFRLACAVSHMDELTLDECIESIRAQSIPVGEPHVVAGVSPCSAAYNLALDRAIADGADVLFHMASDVIAQPDAVAHLLSVFDVDAHSIAIGTGFDVFHGERAPVGMWLLNLRKIGDERFADVYKMDMEFVDRVEAATGSTRAKVSRAVDLGYHHPIWTPSEMYMKFRYVTQKYTPDVVDRFKGFFERELSYNPGNKALLVGRDALALSIDNPHDFGAKDNARLAVEFAEFSADLALDGTEFYVMHRRFLPLAQRLLNSSQTCVCVEDR